MKKVFLSFALLMGALSISAQQSVNFQTACHPEDVKHYDTKTLRERFVMEKVMEADKINLTYSHYDRFIFAAGMNHRFEGGGFMMCPKAKDDDGELDYCIVHDLSVLDFFRFFPSATSGGHVRQKAKVAQLRRKSLRVRSDRPLWVHCDGETGEPSADVLFRISRNRLNLLV